MKKILICAALFCGAVGTRAAHIVVSSNISSNTTWTANNTYSLDGLIVVDSGVTLTIQPGVKICSGTESGLVIQSTAQLIANGTADSMIVFTSNQGNSAAPGDWLGILWLGAAENNEMNTSLSTTAVVRNGLTFLGGYNDDLDDNGSMRYVSIAYAGQKTGTYTYPGGLVCNSLGVNTEIEQVQIINSESDGMVLIGGKPTINDVYVQNNLEVGLKLDKGNRSSITRLLAVKSPNTLSSLPLNTKGIEVINNATNPLYTPLTNPILDAYTLIGPNHCAARTGDQSIGMHIRSNGGGDFRNGVVSNFEIGLLLDGDETMDRTTATTLTFNYTSIVNNNDDLELLSGPWSGCVVSPNTIEGWFNGNDCGTENNDSDIIINLDYDASVCNDYCATEPIFKLDELSEVPNRPLSSLRIGALQEEPVFTWVDVCPAGDCGVSPAKAKASMPLQLYPNPSNTNVNIKLPTTISSNAVLHVVDMVSGHHNAYPLQGASGTYSMDIRGWAQGFYRVYIVQDEVVHTATLQVMTQL